MGNNSENAGLRLPGDRSTKQFLIPFSLFYLAFVNVHMERAMPNGLPGNRKASSLFARSYFAFCPPTRRKYVKRHDILRVYMDFRGNRGMDGSLRCGGARMQIAERTSGHCFCFDVIHPVRTSTRFLGA